MDEPESQSRPPDPAPAKPQRFSMLLRLWCLRGPAPVSGPANLFLIALSLVWLLLWVAIDWWEALPDPQFLIAGVPLFPWYALAILAMAALLRGRSNPAPSFAAALMLSLGLVPLPLLLAVFAVPFLGVVGLCIAAVS